MDFTPDAKDPARLSLAGDLNIYHAAEAKPRLLAAIDAGPELELDLSGVEEVDAAGLQLLILAKRHAGRTGKTLRLASHSAPVLEVLELTGTAGFFGDPIVMGAH